MSTGRFFAISLVVIVAIVVNGCSSQKDPQPSGNFAPAGRDRSLVNEAAIGNTAALDHLSTAATAGHADAETGLGLLYAAGRGVPQSYTVAAQWYSKAAVQHYAPGQYHLGVLYFLGRGVQRNYDLARKWADKSASQGLGGDGSTLSPRGLGDGGTAGPPHH